MGILKNALLTLPILALVLSGLAGAEECSSTAKIDDTNRKFSVLLQKVSGIEIRVLGERAVAGFAIHTCMLAVFLLVENVAMAGLTGLMSGEVDRLGGHVGKGIAAIVAVLSKAGWD